MRFSSALSNQKFPFADPAALNPKSKSVQGLRFLRFSIVAAAVLLKSQIASLTPVSVSADCNRDAMAGFAAADG